jgi:type I restriction enzyme R subunit
MTTQSEAILEDNLIKQLNSLGYEKVSVKNEETLLTNLKVQIEKHNNTTITDTEYKKNTQPPQQRQCL